MPHVLRCSLLSLFLLAAPVAAQTPDAQKYPPELVKFVPYKSNPVFSPVKGAWDANFKGGTPAPLRPVRYGVGGNAHVYVEFIAVATHQGDLAGHAVRRADLPRFPLGLYIQPRRSGECLEQDVCDISRCDGSVEIAINTVRHRSSSRVTRRYSWE